MNKKDIIIAATVVNVGLLVALFIGALKQDRKKGTIALNTISKEENVVGKSPSLSLPIKESDQMDQILNQYVSQNSNAEETQKFSPPVLVPEQKEKEKSKPINEKQMRTVTVEKGDTLEKLAHAHDVEVNAIIKLNQLPDSRLQVGQQLQLPEKRAKKPVNAQKRYYIVQDRDNPWTIAQKHNIKVEELLHLNNMDDAKARKLRPGDRLRIK